MKRIMLSAGMIISLSAAAQDNGLLQEYFKNRPLKSPTLPGINMLIDSVRQSQVSVMPMAMVYSHPLPSGEKVYTLPQDQMPCVVPDLNQFNMPNAGADIKINRSGPGAIPNPGTGGNIAQLPRGKMTLLKKP